MTIQSGKFLQCVLKMGEQFSQRFIYGNMAVVAQELDNQIRQVFAFGEQFCGGSVKLGVQELDNQRLAFR